MNEQTAKLLSEKLDALAAKLGVTAEHLWGVLVRQATVEAAISTALAVMWLTVLIVCIVAVKRNAMTWITELSKDYHQQDEAVLWISGTPVISGAAIGLVSFILSRIHLLDALRNVLNPEYWALQQVLNLFN